jgi:hypothetical protein
MTPTIRAKFKCTAKLPTEYGQTKVSCHPVGPNWNPETKKCEFPADCGDNKEFWEASPSGELILWIKNKAASDKFEVGRSYYLDFTPAD